MGAEVKPRGGLSAKAYAEVDGSTYEPYIPAAENMAEFTLKAVVIGCLIGVVFGAANAYLGLKVGLTVSASIPAAVMAVATFKVISGIAGKGTILETNMVQTVGSSGESLAAGVIFTLPALYLWGSNPTHLEIFFIATAGGLLGVLFMIPLRAYLIVREHGKLPYPEGTACAEVLVASQSDTGKAKRLFQGLGIGALYQTFMHEHLFGLWAKEPADHVPGFEGAEVGAEVTPELLGVGYIIGPKIAAIMLSGGILGWMVLIPLIKFFGAGLTAPLYPQTTMLISEMEPIQVWSFYVRYIGAGGVAFAGIFALLKSIPVIAASFKAGISNMGGSQESIRTQRDIPPKFQLIGAITLALVIAVFLAMDLLAGNVGEAVVAGILIVVFAFFFVTVSSRIVGLLGSSSNPISGMTIATLIVSCLIFIAFDLHTLPNAKVAVLVVGAFVCIAAAIAGDTSQDLKTGFLVGATPRMQQMGEMLGVLTSALSMGFVMTFLAPMIASGEFRAPQANLMKLVIDGVFDGNLPWVLVLSGAFIAIFVEMLGISSLAFAVGLYLPMSLSVPIMAGGLIRLWVDWRRNDSHREDVREDGVLYCSGLIAGAALTGVFAVILVGMMQLKGTSMAFLAAPAEQVRLLLARPGVYLDVNHPHKAETLDGKPVSAYLAPDVEHQFTITLANQVQSRGSVNASGFERKYVFVENEKVVVSSTPQSHNLRGVLAFAFLMITLVFVVKRR